jgi:FkbM family methyltransferase
MLMLSLLAINSHQPSSSLLTAELTKIDVFQRQNEQEDVMMVPNNNNITFKTEGIGWKIWDRKSVLDIGSSPLTGSTRVCEWATFRYNKRDDDENDGTTLKTSVPMCVHKSPDVLSDTIRKKGTWDECSRLVEMWNYESRKENKATTLPKVFVDIGANIGSCVLQMLLETDAVVLAFEPNPRNLFPLTSTLLLLEPKLRNRVYVFPIGIGEMTGSASVTNDLRSNAGASMLKQDGSGNGGAGDSIAVEPLDSILSGDTYIPVAKIDVQGFECKVLRGMKGFLKPSSSLPPPSNYGGGGGISSVFTEVEKRYLMASGCKPKEIFDHLKKYGNYAIYEDDGTSPISGLSKIMQPLDKKFYNIVARKEPHT